VIAGVDYYHPMSGVVCKLRAFQEFLKANRELAESIVFLQYIVPAKASSKVEHLIFQRMERDIKELQEGINTEFGPDIVRIYFEGPSKAARCALWARANLLFITSLRDGLCLVNCTFS